MSARLDVRRVETRFIASLTAPPKTAVFLTWRIDYFRPLALLLANTRKSETSNFQSHPSKDLPQGRLKTPFSPLYGTFRPHFSLENWPWIEISIPWIGESMGWKSDSMGWIERNTPRGRISNAKRRTKARVRFNALPYSAQGFAAVFRGGRRGYRREGCGGCGAKKWGFRLALPARCTNFVWQKPRPAQ